MPWIVRHQKPQKTLTGCFVIYSSGCRQLPPSGNENWKEKGKAYGVQMTGQINLKSLTCRAWYAEWLCWNDSFSKQICFVLSGATGNVGQFPKSLGKWPCVICTCHIWGPDFRRAKSYRCRANHRQTRREAPALRPPFYLVSVHGTPSLCWWFLYLSPG